MPATANPYTNATDISAMLPAAITATSRPNSNEVASSIWQISSEVEAAAAYAGYTVPVSPTAAEAFAIISGCVRSGVAYQAAAIMFPNNGPGTALKLVDEFKADYLRVLESIRDGKTPLVGAALESSETARITGRSFSTSNQGDPDSFARRIVWKQEF